MGNKYILTGTLQEELRKAAQMEAAELTADMTKLRALLGRAANALEDVEGRLDGLWQQTRWDGD